MTLATLIHSAPRSAMLLSLPEPEAPEGSSMIGLGLYTIAEASAYTSIPARDISRWLFGYRSSKNEDSSYRAGIWRPELAGLTHEKAISFHDLLELRFVHAFRQHGVSLQAIRAASEHARLLFKRAYPFTCTRFQTDGRSIFACVMAETHDDTLLDLVKKQYVFKQIISASLYEGIEYDAHGEAGRWFPLGRSHSVVLDPERQFGKPIVAASGISTACLHEAWLAESKDSRRVAKLYEISVDAVLAAIRFEQRDAA